MIKVLVESPFAGKDEKETERNIRYTRACMRDCLMRGEAPFASYLLYAQKGILDDNSIPERKLGIEAGLLWGASAAKTVVYVDFGISKGMEIGIQNAKENNRPIEYRNLDLDALAEILYG